MLATSCDIILTQLTPKPSLLDWLPLQRRASLPVAEAAPSVLAERPSSRASPARESRSRTKGLFCLIQNRSHVHKFKGNASTCFRSLLPFARFRSLKKPFSRWQVLFLCLLLLHIYCAPKPPAEFWLAFSRLPLLHWPLISPSMMMLFHKFLALLYHICSFLPMWHPMECGWDFAKSTLEFAC